MPLWLQLAIVVATLLICWAIRCYASSPARQWRRIRREHNASIAARRFKRGLVDRRNFR